MSEPKLVFCTLRQGGEFVTDIECRFADGQKLAAIQVDDAFPQLACDIANWLNDRARADA